MKACSSILVFSILLREVQGFISANNPRVTPFIRTESRSHPQVGFKIADNKNNGIYVNHAIALNSVMERNTVSIEDSLSKEKICVILELTFIEACLQIATGNVAVFKLFITTIKSAYDRRIPIPELIESLESTDVMRNSANRKLTTEEECLRTLWLNLSYLTLEFLERIEGGKEELAFDSNIDQALEESLSVSLTTRGMFKFIVEEKVRQFLGLDINTPHIDGLNLETMDTAEAAMMTYSLRIIDKTLKVVKEERMAQGLEMKSPQISQLNKSIVNQPAQSVQHQPVPSSKQQSDYEKKSSAVDFDAIKRNIQAWNDNGVGATANVDKINVPGNVQNTAVSPSITPVNQPIQQQKAEAINFDAIKRNIQTWNENGVGAVGDSVKTSGVSANTPSSVSSLDKQTKEQSAAVDFDLVKRNIQSWNNSGVGAKSTNDNVISPIQDTIVQPSGSTPSLITPPSIPRTNEIKQQNPTVFDQSVQIAPSEAGLTKEKICVILELTFIEACLQIATGNVAALKLFIATLKSAYDRRIPIPELIETLESMDRMRNSANRQLSTEESCLRTLWLNLSYLTLEYLERIEQGKAELAFDSNMDEALKETLSVSILTRGTYKFIVEEKVRQFLGQNVQTNHVGGLNLQMLDTAEAAMMTYSLRIIDKTLKVVSEERMSDGIKTGPLHNEPEPNQQNIGMAQIDQKKMTSMNQQPQPKQSGAVDFDVIKRNIQAWNDSGLGAATNGNPSTNLIGAMQDKIYPTVNQQPQQHTTMATNQQPTQTKATISQHHQQQNSLLPMNQNPKQHRVSNHIQQQGSYSTPPTPQQQHQNAIPEKTEDHGQYGVQPTIQQVQYESIAVDQQTEWKSSTDSTQSPNLLRTTTTTATTTTSSSVSSTWIEYIDKL